MRKWLMKVIAVLVGVFVLSGCEAPWYGTGTVIEKIYVDTESSYIFCGNKTMCPIPSSNCWRLTVVEKNGEEHVGCVTQRVWNDAMLGHKITITEEYK